jgi:RNA polymerase sigma-70 factor (ECF subfamily)
MERLWGSFPPLIIRPVRQKVPVFERGERRFAPLGVIRAEAVSRSQPLREPSEEAALVRRARQGDRKAFAALMELYRERVVRLALHRVGSMEDAQDLCQETFLRLHRSLETYDPDRAFSPWLYRIAHNVILDHLRRKRSRPVTTEPELAQLFEEMIDPAAENPQRTCLNQEMYGEVRAAIQSLPDNYRSVVVFRFLEDLSYSEIAEALDLTEANVMMRISRARRMLRDRLKHLLVGDTDDG